MNHPPVAADPVADTPAAPAAHHEEQRVAWAELFFDLIWVFAITQITTTLAGAHSAGEAARTVLLFLPLWWGWVGTTLVANLAGSRVDRAAGRLVLFGAAGCGLLVSVAIGQAYGDHAILFAVAYAVLRLVLWAVRSGLSGASWRPALEPFAVALFVSAPLYLAGAVLGGTWQTALWATAALIELSSPRLLRRSLSELRFETAHLPERFGLVLIIALGETVVATGNQAAAGRLGPPELTALLLAFTLIVLLWWTYFHYGAPAVRHSLEHTPAQSRIVTDVFSYAHLGYVVAIVAVAVGLKKLLAHPLDVPHSLPELLLAPGVALYLWGFCYARWRMFGAATMQRFTAAVTCCAIAAAAVVLPLMATAALLVAVLFALNGFEAWLIRTHRPLPLLRLPGRSASAAG
ncbi:low temperature requirement protein A [Catellatospora citrea]|uniref:Low temperature requirement protein A n=1 Tax=Catellatospora citrea TaxID=53366 RepID=A0A8J3NYW2_9ACTN|nr:low temperature requirement protein A [Catellatospora citrea]RKE05805.1 low temperature requirement protein LtrA [Catellatospora citrea]GIF97166.1 low temperature requirement protein A [Catellatospora citrea]